MRTISARVTINYGEMDVVCNIYKIKWVGNHK